MYHHRWQKWNHRSLHRCHSDGSEGGNLADTSLPTPGNDLVVSELRGSLTDLSREVKTYSFCPAEEGEVPPIIVDPPGTVHYASTSSPSPTKPFFPPVPSSPPHLVEDKEEVLVMRENGEPGEGVRVMQENGEPGEGVRLSGHSMDSEADSEMFDHRLANFTEEEEDSFSTGLTNVFDNSMRKLRSTDQRCHSLPNVFSLEHEVIDTSCVSTTTDENTSTSVSVTSVLGDSASALDDPAIEPATTPERLGSTSSAISVNGHGTGSGLHVRTSSATTLPASFRMTSSLGGGREPPVAVAGGGVAVPSKRWSGNDVVVGYESGSEVGEGERRGRLSPAGDRGAWMSISYAHPPRERSPGEVRAEPSRVQRRKKMSGSGYR